MASRTFRLIVCSEVKNKFHTKANNSTEVLTNLSDLIKYSNDSPKPKIKFISYDKSISILISHIKKNKSQINLKTLKDDKFLNYAKKIN